MPKQLFWRNLVVVAGLFLVIAVVVQIDLVATRPFQDYLAFVVGTDFSLGPVMQKIPFLETLGSWEPGTWFKAWLKAFPEE